MFWNSLDEAVAIARNGSLAIGALVVLSVAAAYAVRRLRRRRMAADARRVYAQSIAWTLPGDRAVTVREHEGAVLDAGGIVIRYGRLYGAGTWYETTEPDPPRIQVDEAARRTMQILDAPPGIVELVE